MNKTATSAVLAGAILAGTLAIAPTASAAPAATPTAAVQVQERHNKDRDEWIFGLKKPRVYVCRIAPALCR
jgi:hypothetical protein